MISWPSSLVMDIARRRCVLVLGAGVSMNSTNAGGDRPPDWGRFLEGAIERMVCSKALQQEVKRLIKSGDYLTACDVIRQDLGQDFADYARETFLTPGYTPAKIHELIEGLDCQIVITPNFDKIYETQVARTQGNSVIVKSYADIDLAECIRLPNRVVLKIHGSVDSPSSMILGRRDYARARSGHENFYRIFSALILTHTFVFLGCGLNDPDIALLLEDYSFRHSVGRTHFIVIPKTAAKRKEVRSVYEDTRNLSFLLYDSANTHALLTSSLVNLVDLVAAQRDELSRTQGW